MKAQTLTHLQILFLLPVCRWNLKAKTLTHFEAFFLYTSFPSNYTHSSTSLQTTVCSSDLLILSNQTNVPTHFSSLNSALLCKQTKMYGQGRYTITLKNKNKKEMYSLTSTVSPLYFLFLFQNLSLSLSLSLILTKFFLFLKTQNSKVRLDVIKFIFKKLRK